MSADPAIQYAQSTAPTGTVGVLGTGTASGASEATVASYGALATGSTRMSPQVSSSTRTTAPASPATFSGIGWRMDTAVFATDNARTLAGQTWPVIVMVRTTATVTITCDVTVILFLDNNEVGRATVATNAVTGTAAAINVNVPITAGIISNTATPKVTMEIYLVTTLGASLAYTMIVATGGTSTSVNPGVIAQDATRTATETPPTAADTAARVTSVVRLPSDTFPTATDTARRVFSAIRTAADTLPGATDAASRQTSDFRRTTDAVSVPTETTTRVVAYARIGSDVHPAMIDTASRTTSASRTASDSQAFADTARRSTSLSRFTSDSQAFIDTAPRSVVFARLGADIHPTMTEVASRQIGYVRRPTDILPGMADTASRIIGLAITATDYITTLDSASRSLTFLRVTQDQFQPTDDPPSNQIKMVAGYVYNTDGSPYLGGATVILIREDGVVVQTQTSSVVDGSYNFPRNFLDTHSYTVAAHTFISGAPYQAVTPRALAAV